MGQVKEHFANCKLCQCGELLLENAMFGLVRCPSCGLIFAARVFEDCTIRRLYRDAYSPGGAYEPLLKAQHRLRCGKRVFPGLTRKRLVDQVLRSGCQKIVELGPGVGVVAAYLKRRSGVSYIGYELDAATARSAEDMGLNIRQGSADRLDERESADAVLAFEVLEHIQPLRSCLTSVNRALRAGGLFALTVPNYDRRLNGGGADHLGQSPPPVHLNFWTELSLKQTLRLFGFEPVLLNVRRPHVDLRRPVLSVGRYLGWRRGKFRGPTIMCLAEKRRQTEP